MNFPIRWSSEEQKKIPFPPAAWQKLQIQDARTTFETKSNGYAVICGRIVVIDLDSKKAKDEGVTFPPDFIKCCEKSQLVEKTPNGRHYYFKLSDDQDTLDSQMDVVYYGEKLRRIDLLSKGKFCICAPTIYHTESDTECEYKVIRGDFESISYLPDELYKGFTEKPSSSPTDPLAPELSDDCLELLMNIFNALPTKPCAIDYDIWLRVGLWIKKACPGPDGFRMFDEWSKKAIGKYSSAGVMSFWRQAKPTGEIGFRSIMYYIKKYASEATYQMIAKEIDIYFKEELYEQKKQEFEENHFYCQDTQDICQINEDGSLTHFSIQNVKYTFANFNYMIGEVQTEFMKQWLSSPKKRMYRRIVSTPAKVASDEYNLFRGFIGSKAQLIDEVIGEKGLERFKYLVNLLGSKEKEYTKYITQWLSLLIQKPQEIPRSCMIFIGKEGIGKDTVIDFIGKKLIGNQCYQIIQNAEHELYDTHSTVMVNSFLQKLEEASSTSNRKNADNLKTLITQTSHKVNEKNVKKFSIETYPHFIMTTNNQSPVKLDETSRRFFISRVSSDRLGAEHSDWWTETHSLLNDESTIAAVWKYLSEHDCSLPAVVLKTSYFKDLQEADSDTVISWVKDSVKIEEASSTDLYYIYKEWCQENLKPWAKNPIAFGKSLATLVQDNEIDRRMLHGKSLYSKGLPLVAIVTEDL